jgi:hypothetical protein
VMEVKTRVLEVKNTRVGAERFGGRRGYADMRTRGHAHTHVKWKTRTCGHASQVENADMRTRNLLNFKKYFTTIIILL